MICRHLTYVRFDKKIVIGLTYHGLVVDEWCNDSLAAIFLLHDYPLFLLIIVLTNAFINYVLLDSALNNPPILCAEATTIHFTSSTIYKHLDVEQKGLARMLS